MTLDFFDSPRKDKKIIRDSIINSENKGEHMPEDLVLIEKAVKKDNSRISFDFLQSYIEKNKNNYNKKYINMLFSFRELLFKKIRNQEIYDSYTKKTIKKIDSENDLNKDKILEEKDTRIIINNVPKNKDAESILENIRSNEIILNKKLEELYTKLNKYYREEFSSLVDQLEYAQNRHN